MVCWKPLTSSRMNGVCLAIPPISMVRPDGTVSKERLHFVWRDCDRRGVGKTRRVRHRQYDLVAGKALEVMPARGIWSVPVFVFVNGPPEGCPCESWRNRIVHENALAGNVPSSGSSRFPDSK